MKLSRKKQDALYDAIHLPLADAYIALKRSDKKRMILARTAREIWLTQKKVLGLDD